MERHVIDSGHRREISGCEEIEGGITKTGYNALDKRKFEIRGK